MTAAPSRRTVAGIVTLCLLLLSAACGTAIPGTPVPGSAGTTITTQVRKPADLPYGRDAKLVDAWATMRSWDLCAIHDPIEASNMLGADRGSVVPYTDLSGCRVEVDGVGSSWELQISVGTSEHLDESYAAVTVDGTKLDRYKDKRFGKCSYDLPFRNGAVLSLTVGNVAINGDADQQRTCQVGEDYLHTVLPRMKQPPLVGTGASEPPVLMAGQDPCAGIAAIRDDIRRAGGVQLSLSVRNPVDCGVTASAEDYTDSKSYELEFNMGFTQDLERGTKVTIGGMRGISEKLSDCRTILDTGAPPITQDNYGTQNIQTIEVTTPSCKQTDLMERMVAPYLEALHAKPVPAKDDAVHIGDLNPPSTPKDVGAPFDPCTVVSWNDFPAGTHGPDETPPYLANLSVRNNNVQTGCVFHGDEVVTTVGWGRDSLETLQQRNAIVGGPTRFAGRAATKDDTKNNEGKTMCTYFVSAQQGVIAVVTSQNESKADTCAVDRALLKVITSKVP